MIKITMPKKFKYIIPSLVIILILSSISLSEDLNYYDLLSTIAKHSNNMDSVDKNENNIIDEADHATTAINLVKMPDPCPAGYFLKGFGQRGNPICINPEIKCDDNICQIVPSKEDEKLLSAMTYSIAVKIDFNMTGNTTMDPIMFNHPLVKDKILNFDPELCREDTNPNNVEHDQDRFCIKSIILTNENVELKIYYDNNGNYKFIDSFNVMIQTTSRSMTSHWHLDSQTEEEKILMLPFN